MSDKELSKLIDEYDAKAEAAYDNFQQTGAQRYYRTYTKNSELAEALRMALSAKDEHSDLVNLKYNLVRIATAADLRTETPEAIVNELLHTCEVFKIYPGGGNKK